MTTDNNRILRRAVRLAMLSGGTLATGLATSTSIGQTQPAPANEQTEGAAPITEVVVTGSRIVTPSLESVSPVIAVTSAEIKDQGVTRVEDLLNSLPQVVSDQGSGLSMGSNGTATVNLRGLGVQRTLVLVNGRRLMGGDPAAGAPSGSALSGASAADVDQIPVALLDRVDVLTGGAASTYGADAVAGVVNFVMNDHFEGLRVDINAGIYNHDNHNSWIGPLLKAEGSPVPTGSNWDGANKDLTLIMGHGFADGAGNFEGYLGYRRTSPITASNRDHTACVLNNNLDLSSGASFGPYACHGSINSAPSVIFNQVNFAPGQVGPAGSIVPYYQSYNYAASHYLQRIDERYTAGFFGHLKFNPHAEVYTEFMFMDDNTRGNYAPAGLFLGAGFATSGTPPLRDGNFYTNCGVGGYGNAGMNPFLTASEFGTLCAPGSPYTVVPNGTVPVPGDIQLLIARRNIEGGPRQDTYVHTTFRGVFGVRGEITTDWTYDTSVTYGVVRSSDYHTNDVSASRAQNALLAVMGPNGVPICRGGQPGCVPWNVFNPAVPVTQAELNYISVPAELMAYGNEDIWTSFVSGDLTHAGVKLPTADEGLKLVFGTEYRRETATRQPDSEYLAGDLGNVIVGPFDAGYHVWEGFTEARLPLANNLPGVKSLDFEAGYRYSSYTSGFNTNTYKVGLTWSPVSDLRARASYNKAVRVPNVAELYDPPVVELDAGTDLCAAGAYSKPTPANEAACALTNYGKPIKVPTPPSPASQYNGILGGNPSLKPENGKTTDIGIVLTPRFLSGFSTTVDYVDIKITDVITSYGPNLIQNNCILSGSATSYFCQLVHRDGNGTLWASPQGYTIDPLLNIAGLENKSIDVGMVYLLDMGNAGRLHSRLDGTYLMHLTTTPGGGVAPYDCAGYYGPSCAPVTPKWRHRFTLDWDTPVAGLSGGATWRFFGSATNTLINPNNPDYVGEATIAKAGPPPDGHIPTISYLDLHASYSWNKVTLRVGCNNVLDKDPPTIDTANTGGNSIYAESNTYPSVYDIAGRYLFANLTVDF
ncbi:MAG: TonB-dependent receptor [Gammaproteobacteria bacterium]|nr:TonB-dependent receptor [Gammaproteobacteria bacterium]